MPRSAREKSESGIYHVIVRGINRQDIFHDEEDYSQYLKLLYLWSKIKMRFLLKKMRYISTNTYIDLNNFIVKDFNETYVSKIYIC